MNPMNAQQNENWCWIDVYTKSGNEWVFRKRVAREYDKTFDQMRMSIARMLSSSPAVPMRLEDFRLVKRP